MKLDVYRKKRDFSRTPEPKTSKKRKRKFPLFVVQKHAARRLHYDFRLEAAGTLKSWAIPKGPSLDPEERRLAVMVEDHPRDYAKFEGLIPRGNYGAGPVLIWDIGTYERVGEGKSKEITNFDFEKGHIAFRLHGKKLNGIFDLVRTQEPSWILIKRKDAYASASSHVHEQSVKSQRTLKEISGIIGVPTHTSLELSPFPKDLRPMLASVQEQPFDNPDWLFELKLDGYRILAEVQQTISLKSRKGLNYNHKYPNVVQEFKNFPHTALLDGEIVALNAEGIPEFGRLQQHEPRINVYYYVFDILYLNGYDLRDLPLISRKNILLSLLEDKAYTFIRFSNHIPTEGRALFGLSKKMGFEGIIGKRQLSTYQSGVRTSDWVKIKHEKTDEAFIIGFTEPRGSRKHLGALVLAKHRDGKLTYVGHSGGGFTDEQLQEIKQQLLPLKVDQSPLSYHIKTNAPVTWIKPKHIAEITFQGWTEDGVMRQPIFLRMRNDLTEKESKLECDNEKKVYLKNLGKVFWPEEGITKGDIVDYYRTIAPRILPYLADRPENLLRHPNGITGKSFYHKDLADIIPEWIQRANIRSESDDKTRTYGIINDLDSLLFMINLGTIELNPWNSRIQHLDYPDYLIIDLDPEDIPFVKVVETAICVKAVLDEFGLNGYPKTSGATGIHVLLPLGAKYTYDETRIFAELLSRVVHSRIPEYTSVERSPKKRQKKVYLDFLQNRRGQTITAPYAVRPRPGAPVSMPLEWSEVNRTLHPKIFTIKNAAEEIEKRDALFRPILGKGINMQTALNELQKIK